MSDIFFSYQSNDRKRVKPFYERFTELAFEVNWDQKIHTGKQWEEWIFEEIMNTRSVIVFWSKSSIESSSVRHEARLAKDGKKLLPVMIDELNAMNLARLIGFDSVQTADLSHWNGDPDDQIFQRLVQSVENAIKPKFVERVLNNKDAQIRALSIKIDGIIDSEAAIEMKFREEARAHRDSVMNQRHLKDEKDQLKQQLLREETETKKLIQAAQNSEVELKKLKTESQESAGQIAALKETISDNDNIVKDLRNTVATLKGNIQKVDSSLKKNKKELSQTIGRLDKLKSFKDRHNRLKWMQMGGIAASLLLVGGIVFFAVPNEEDDSKFSELTNQLEKAKGGLKLKSDELEDRSERIHALNSQLKGINEEKIEIASRLTKLETENRKLLVADKRSVKLEAGLKDKIGQKESIIESRLFEINRLKNELKNKSDDVVKLERSVQLLEVLRAENKKLRMGFSDGRVSYDNEDEVTRVTRRLQQALYEKGAYNGSIDGESGSMTEIAVSVLLPDVGSSSDDVTTEELAKESRDWSDLKLSSEARQLSENWKNRNDDPEEYVRHVKRITDRVLKEKPVEGPIYKPIILKQGTLPYDVVRLFPDEGNEANIKLRINLANNPKLVFLNSNNNIEQLRITDVSSGRQVFKANSKKHFYLDLSKFYSSIDWLSKDRNSMKEFELNLKQKPGSKNEILLFVYEPQRS